MIRLIWYEWKKLWKNASVLKIFFFFLVLSSVIFWGVLKESESWNPEYVQIHNEIDQLNQQERDDWLRASQEKEMDWDKQKALSYISKESAALANYETYRESIQTQYEESRKISIFSDSNGSYMKKIADTYENLQIKAPMELQPYMGMQKLLDFYAGDFITIVLLIYFVCVVFIQEEKSGKTPFALTMVKGKKQLFFAKSLTICGGVIIFTCLTFAINVILAIVMFGGISISAAAQSISSLYAVPYAWTIGRYLCVLLILKVIAVILLAIIASALAKYSGSEVVTVAGIVGITGFSIWVFDTFQGNGIVGIVRLWNIWAVLRGNPIISTYELIQVGELLIEAVWGVVFLLILTLALGVFAGKTKYRERKQKSRRWREQKFVPHTIFHYEMKKLWIYQGGIWLFLVCILLQGMTVWQHKNYIGTDEYYYQTYIDRFGMEITDETEGLISREDERLNEIEQKLYQETDAQVSDNLRQQLECRGGFEKYKERVFGLQEKGKTEFLMKDTQYSLLFDFTEVSRMMVILICVSFAFLIPAVFHKEKETRMEILQKTSFHGGKELWDAKIVANLIYVVLLVLLFNGFTFLYSIKHFSLNLRAPINCLLQYWSSSIECSVLVFYLAGILIQCVVAATMMILISACAKKVKNQYVLTGIVLGGCIIPTLLSVELPQHWLRFIHHSLFVFTYDNAILQIVFWSVAVLGAVIVMRKERRV